MASVIDACECSFAHPDWEKIRDLPYDDVSQEQHWLERTFIDEPPADELAGLWFGLFNPVERRSPVADIYVAGTTQFSDDESDQEWACDPAYFPEGRRARSEILATIYRIAYSHDKGLGNNAEWSLCLAYGALLVKQLLSNVKPNIILGKSNSLGVAVGFDDGDFILLGHLGLDGFTVRCPKSP